MNSDRAVFGIGEHLVITEVPIAAPQSLIGKRLIDAGSLAVAGAYACAIDTQGLAAIDVYLEPTAANAGGTPTLASYSLHTSPTFPFKPDVTLDTAAGAAFVANTVQKLSLTGLNGTPVCKVTWTITTSVDFTPATTHGRAEVRGL